MISNKHFIKESFILIVLFTIISSFVSCSEITEKENRPNIILILIDDLGWNDLGYMGSSFYETPNIDRLAEQGMTFTNAYVTAPNCAPTRASLLTGQYTPRHKVYTVNSSERGDSRLRKIIPIANRKILSLDKKTIAEMLREKGYETAIIGKWHLGEVPEHGPKAQGFDINIGGNALGHPKSYFSPYENDQLKDKIKGEYLTDRLTKEAVEYIESNKNNPFFLYLSHYGVHTPIQAKQDIIKKYDAKEKSEFQYNSTYAAMIQSVDESVGRILEKLNQLHLEENTLIIFLSDNGGMGKVTSMHPLRGSKGMLYEGGIRIPMIMKWDNKIMSNSVSHENVICVDILPTVMDILDMEDSIDQQIDGKTLTPLLFNRSTFSREAIYWHFPAYLEGKAIGGRDEHFRTRPCGVVISGDWKLIQYFEDNNCEMYNLKNDIGETKNSIDIYPERAEELKKLLNNWQEKINAPIPSEPNPEYGL